LRNRHRRRDRALIWEAQRGAARCFVVSICVSADSSWLSSHWADLLFFAGIILFAVLAPLGKQADASRKAEAKSKKVKAEALPHVIAKHDLQPYVPVRADDLGVRRAKSHEQADELTAAFIGHYAMEPIQQGQTIDAATISNGKAALADSSIVGVKFEAQACIDRPIFPHGRRSSFLS
jgi:hypothetical protein